MNNIEVITAINIALVVATFLLSIGRTLKAIELCKESLVLLKHVLNNGALSLKQKFGNVFHKNIYSIMFEAYFRVNDNTNAITYGRKLLDIYRECGDTDLEGILSLGLAELYNRQSKYVEAKELSERAITIMRETGDREKEALAYKTQGIVFYSLGDHAKAKECFEKALAINMEIGDRAGEETCYGILGNVFHSVGDYVRAKECYEKALAINMEVDDKADEETLCGSLGNVFNSLGDYVKAKEYYEKALAITMKIGDRAGGGRWYGNLGNVFHSLGDYVKAKEYYEKALAITMEIGDRAGEGAWCGNLGNVSYSLGDYAKAKEYYKKALVIAMEIGDKAREGTWYVNLGKMGECLGDYGIAKEYYEKALAIRREIGDRAGEASVFKNLVYVYLHPKQKEIKTSKEYLDRTLAININLGSKCGEACSYRALGYFFEDLGDTDEAQEYCEKALAISTDIGDKQGEATDRLMLGSVFYSRREYGKAEEYLEKAISISQNIGDISIEFSSHFYLSLTKFSLEKQQEAISCLLRSIETSQNLRSLNTASDEVKISLTDRHVCSYQLLSGALCDYGYPNRALNVVELGRARALADLMATQYYAEKHVTADPQSWIDIENVRTKESNCTCLYISYHEKRVLLWILKLSGVISFREITVDKETLYHKLRKRATNLDEFFGIIASTFHSLNPRPDCTATDPEPSLTLLYEMLIKPVSDLLDEPEIIIVPDRNLYSVPFAALPDECGKYLSETFRIRIVPSLTTLKLIQDSPVDHHSQTGALIVGDPDVGDVIYNGRLNKDFVSLEGARKESEMIGKMLGVQPLLGNEATRKAVLEKIESASLIHFAAHGNPERGEIALSPSGSSTRYPQEADYLLKMSDISKLQLRAKLVVLSCGHSGRGQIRDEGVVGIARAFLGSGARSVLVSLWQLGDTPTEQFMSRFYEHLVRGESASESLHEAMQWMRRHGFPRVAEWAPFMLIGDNVTFDFKN